MCIRDSLYAAFCSITFHHFPFASIIFYLPLWNKATGRLGLKASVFFYSYKVSLVFFIPSRISGLNMVQTAILHFIAFNGP